MFVSFIFIIIVFFPRTLVYSLALVFYLLIVLFTLVNFTIIRGLLALLVLLVYIGAMMVIISYICAVSPNIKYYASLASQLVALVLFFFIALSFILPSVSGSFIGCSSYSLAPSFLFTDVGVVILGISALFMVVVLIYSTYIRPLASSLRSSSSK